MNTKLNGLYIVTPDWDDTEKLLANSELALKGGARILQYRHKSADAQLRKMQAHSLQRLCKKYHCLFLINDHVDLCVELDADGIHVGGMDDSVEQVRASVGPDKIVGASCYGDMQLAHLAQRQGASYVAFGGFYPSRIKKYPVTTSIDIVAQFKKEVALPCVVIGGMTLDNSTPLIERGTDMVAVISGVYMAENPEQAAREFCQLFV